ncbi:TIGR01841 family phasin [Paraburkholderia hospita]|uniref:TIGR01841 family phasin n=1 Tax=Paraburkholderia hospita TaxID=169430 RepID=UPI000DEFA2A7|nr:TIGR01841 family phasin [Paraburkholderia hospita]AXF05485.1 Phasin (PHA-granule associated protein) [Paraburkholderia hospita]
MSVFTEQLVPLQQGNVITLFALTNQAFQGLQKVAALNLQALRSALAEGEVSWKEALSGQPTEAIVTSQINAMQVAAEKMLSYNRHLYEIASGTQAELLKVSQARHEQPNRDAQTLVDSFATSAPAGAEAAITVLKSAFSTASLTYETVRKAATQAIELTQSNLAATSAAASKAGQQAPAQMSRAAKQ